MDKTQTVQYQGYIMAHYYQYLSYLQEGNNTKAIIELENIINHTDDTQWIKIAQEGIITLSK